MTAPERGRRYRVVTAAVALLAFSTLPLELGLGKIGLGSILVLAFIALWARYRRLPGEHGRAVTVATTLLVGWEMARLTVLTFADGGEPDWALVIREGLTLLGCLAAFALACKPALRPAIRLGAAWCVALLLLQETYQVLAGQDALVAAGYTDANGYHYYTQFDGYRPFGTFTGPTTYATFLAMVGVWVVLGPERRRWTWLLGAAVLIGVFLTETRAAFIGIVAALIAAALLSPEIRRRSGGVVLFAPLVVGLVLVYRPNTFAGFWGRLLSATDSTDQSRETRLDLWQGVVHATSHQHALFVGLGAADWKTTMYQYVGGVVFVLGHAHSNFFQEWYRYGLIGAAIFVAVMVAMIATTTRGARRGAPYGVAALGAVLVFLADSIFNNSLSSANFVLMAFLLAGTGVLDRVERDLVGGSVEDHDGVADDLARRGSVAAGGG